MNRKQAVSLFLAVLIIGTRIGFALNIHYCGTHIAEISLASSPSDCGMEDTANNQYPENPSFAKASCCEDETVLYQNQEPQKQEAESVLQVFDDFFALADKSEPTFSAKSPNLSPQITGYPPPLRDIKIYLLNQSIVVYE
jgi:hypothetical protein